MDAFTSFFDSQSSSRNRWNYSTLKNFREISPVVQNHIKQAYLALICVMVACGRWSLPTYPLEHWRFSNNSPVPGEHYLVAVHTSL